MAIQIQQEELLDRVRGTIYGNCAGDAIGLLTEFMYKTQADWWFGKEKELNYQMKERLKDERHQSRWKTGDWTDDSDQMILILQSLLDNEGKVIPTDFAEKMRKWARQGFKELGDLGGLGIGATTSRVLGDARFLTEPHVVAHNVWVESGRFVAPNGALMRTSILGIHEYEDIDKVIENTLAICKVTHADPRCAAACVALTTAIAMMLQGKHRGRNGEVLVPVVIKKSYSKAKKRLAWGQRKELKKYMNETDITKLKLDEHNKIGYIYKCLGAAFWAFKQDDFRKALTAIVMEAGDADTNGAVAGALLGCKLGYDKIPPSWRDELLHKKWLDEKVERYLAMMKLSENAVATAESSAIESSSRKDEHQRQTLQS
ncbi:ADP-ribosylarginine hydrolase Tri1-like [Glandiceps talaboti]